MCNISLRALGTSLDADRFIRVHKSAIVNISFVKEFNSRGNGDYDILLHDGATLRLSRGYVQSFRQAYHAWHRVAL